MTPHKTILLTAVLFSFGCASSQNHVDAETKKAAKTAAETIQPSQTSTLRSLKDRIDNPDMSMEFIPADRGYQANKTFAGKPAYVKDFYISQKTNVKSYEAKSWWGMKNDRSAEKEYKTKAADTKDYKTEMFATENYDTKDWYMAKKAAAVNPYEAREFRGRGTRQDQFDQQNAYKEPMTIEDVRSLLNKNE